jgi:hypothetical protein
MSGRKFLTKQLGRRRVISQKTGRKPEIMVDSGLLGPYKAFCASGYAYGFLFGTI